MSDTKTELDAIVSEINETLEACSMRGITPLQALRDAVSRHDNQKGCSNGSQAKTKANETRADRR